MKKQIVIFAVGVVLLAVGYVAQSFSVAAGDCQKPSGNSKACYSLTDEVTSCLNAAFTKEQCIGKSLYTDPVQVPDGTTESDSGTTSTMRINCVKQFSCWWGPFVAGKIALEGICQGEPDWNKIPYLRAEKIIVGDNQCPEG